MNLQDNNKIHGIPDGVSYGQFDREEDLNKRINGRQFPDSPLEPNFGLRPLSTKYTKFSLLDKEVKKQNEPDFIIGGAVRVEGLDFILFIKKGEG